MSVASAGTARLQSHEASTWSYALRQSLASRARLQPSSLQNEPTARDKSVLEETELFIDIFIYLYVFACPVVTVVIRRLMG